MATMILATELSRDRVSPIWFLDSSHAILVVPIMGGLTAVLEGLSAPSQIYALAKNRHAFQEGARPKVNNEQDRGKRK